MYLDDPIRGPEPAVSILGTSNLDSEAVPLSPAALKHLFLASKHFLVPGSRHGAAQDVIGPSRVCYLHSYQDMVSPAVVAHTCNPST